MQLECVVRGGTVITDTSGQRSDIGIADGRICAIGDALPPAPREIDATGCLVVPGALDVHTHFDLTIPAVSRTMADDYESGTRAAAAGGITTIIGFAFQRHGQTPSEALSLELEKARGHAHVDYGLHLGVTDLDVASTLDEVVELADAGFASLKIFTATADALSAPNTLHVLQHAREHGIMVSVHAEDGPLIDHLVESNLREGHIGLEYLPQARSAAAEALATFAVSTFAHQLQTPAYFVHLSSADALDAVRRHRDQGAELYVETRPAYLLLDSDKYSLPLEQAVAYACVPPLRTPRDQQALWYALDSGEIDTVASDHSPWRTADRLEHTATFAEVLAGFSSTQTLLGTLYAEGVLRGRLSPRRLVELTAANPAKLFGLYPQKGCLAVGSDADIVLLDPAAEMAVSAPAMQSRSDTDPFEGFRFRGWPKLTIARGEVVYADGQVTSSPGRGRLLKRTRYRAVSS